MPLNKSRPRSGADSLSPAPGRRVDPCTIWAIIPHLWHRIKQHRLRKLLLGDLGAGGVLKSRNLAYVAYRPDWDYLYDCFPEGAALSDRWVSNNRKNNSGDLPRFYGLVLNIEQVVRDAVPGDFAEVGVYRGNSAALLAHFARLHGRTVLLFDTYEGFEARDLTGSDARKEPRFQDTSLDVVRDNVGDGSVEYVKGYFPDTVTDAISNRRYAVVHLDCDLYAPTKAGLEFFYPRLSPGGMIILHDYANPYWDGIKRAVDEFLPGIPELLAIMPDKSGTAILRKSR